MTPANAIPALKGNLYRTHAQKANAKNFEETTTAIVTYIRKQYPDAADEIAANREVVLIRPMKPRKPKKNKKRKTVRIKEDNDDDDIGFQTPKTSKKAKIEPPPSGSSGVFTAKRIDDEDDSYDSSSDDSEDSALIEYEMLLEDYKDERKEYRQQKKKLAEGRKYARDVILAQCTREMKEKLQVRDSFDEMKTDSNVIALLALIRTCGLDYSEEGYVFQNQVHALRDLLTFQ